MWIRTSWSSPASGYTSTPGPCSLHVNTHYSNSPPRTMSAEKVLNNLVMYANVQDEYNNLSSEIIHADHFGRQTILTVLLILIGT